MTIPSPQSVFVNSLSTQGMLLNKACPPRQNTGDPKDVRVNLIKELLQQLIFGPVSPSREKSAGLLFNLYESSNFLELKRITETKVTFKWSWNLQ